MPQEHNTPNVNLVQWDAMRSAIEQARSIDEVKQIRDKAQALAAYARQQRESHELQNQIAEIKIRAERRAGELLRESELPSNQYETLESGGSQGKPALADLGISKKQSHQWQTIAELPEQVFETEIEAVKETGGELTSVHIYRKARNIEIRTNNEIKLAVDPPQGEYRCIVIDPPWPMQKIEREARPRQGSGLDYPVMALSEIADLNIKDLAFDDCHLYLWTTQKFLPHALGFVEIWEFNYQCLLTWVKPVGITPYSWMYNTEHVVFARRGNLPLSQLGIRLSFEAPVRGHSVKPKEFYEIVNRASPGPRLDMFARQQHSGFTAWGNET